MDAQTVLLIAVLVLQLLVLAKVRAAGLRTDWRIPRLERKLDRVLEHLGAKFEDDPMEMVRPLLLAGRKMDAIKEYRRITGVGLKEAKEAVDGMDLEMPSR
jgi:ribosomal protein L7/L12